MSECGCLNLAGELWVLLKIPHGYPCPMACVPIYPLAWLSRLLTAHLFHLQVLGPLVTTVNYTVLNT